MTIVRKGIGVAAISAGIALTPFLSHATAGAEPLPTYPIGCNTSSLESIAPACPWMADANILRKLVNIFGSGSSEAPHIPVIPVTP
jgi:hypothetical protein